jgi:hypothetical protein
MFFFGDWKRYSIMFTYFFILFLENFQGFSLVLQYLMTFVCVGKYMLKSTLSFLSRDWKRYSFIFIYLLFFFEDFRVFSLVLQYLMTFCFFTLSTPIFNDFFFCLC